MTDEIRAFIDNIPMEPLYNEIRRILNIPELEFEYEAYPSNGAYEVDIYSQDFIDMMPEAIKFLFKEMLVVSNPYDTHVIRERRYGYYMFKGSIKLTCYTESGVLNGVEILDFAYDESNGWRF